MSAWTRHQRRLDDAWDVQVSFLRSLAHPYLVQSRDAWLDPSSQAGARGADLGRARGTAQHMGGTAYGEGGGEWKAEYDVNGDPQPQGDPGDQMGGGTEGCRPGG